VRIYIIRKAKIMEYENKHAASRGVAGTALGLGAGALGIELLNALNGGNGLAGLFGGNKSNYNAGELAAIAAMMSNGHNCCHENTLINRYEAEQQAEITKKDMEIAYLRGRDAAKSDTLETYGYINGELNKIREKQAAQDVKNAQIEGTFAVLGEQNKALRNEFMCALNRERDERCCGDNSIVNYANATFYPKLVADVTVGTTTTAQSLYNPLPNCGRCCG
jgi:hypothetical protein